MVVRSLIRRHLENSLTVSKLQIVVIGGGAAGFFGAINAAEAYPEAHVVILEATRRTLTKVKISGGGRCNVTHHCFEPAKLTENYPRGRRELRGPFSKFQPRDTVAWFAARGVDLKAEADGRMFPTTNQSQTIIDCLEGAAKSAGVEVCLGVSVTALEQRGDQLAVTLKNGDVMTADRVLLATGSAPPGVALAASLGHKIIPPVPSLFTFNIKDPRLLDLAGLSFDAVQLDLDPGDGCSHLTREGPMLITHWGMSGPAVLKLSAFGAIRLHASGYQATLKINFMPHMREHEALAVLMDYKNAHPKRSVAGHGPFDVIPRRFWQRILDVLDIAPTLTYADISKALLMAVAQQLTAGSYKVEGKGVFKEEFVTAGGVALSMIDFRTMASTIVPQLYFAGEVLDIDGITGGFNFQAAWTTSWIAAKHMVS
jgi:predicted Rossmann fold flavoprotein